jgi:hypothetical protein
MSDAELAGEDASVAGQHESVHAVPLKAVNIVKH